MTFVLGLGRKLPFGLGLATAYLPNILLKLSCEPRTYT
jgi:hypothetical protein